MEDKTPLGLWSLVRRKLPDESMYWRILPSGNRYQFQNIQSLLLRRGIRPYFLPLIGGGRTYVIAQPDHLKLPTTRQKGWSSSRPVIEPFLPLEMDGKALHGFSIFRMSYDLLKEWKQEKGWFRVDWPLTKKRIFEELMVLGPKCTSVNELTGNELCGNFAQYKKKETNEFFCCDCAEPKGSGR